MATIDYKQKIKDYMNSSEVDTLYKSMLNNLFPELAESEDERIRKEITAILQYKYEKYSKDPKYCNALKWIDWLEKQGEKGTNRNNSEIPNPVWGEGDESRMDNLCHFLEEYGNQYYGHLTLQCTISWLKSFKDRRTWKPSDEQMKALDFYIKTYVDTEGCYGSEVLELYKQLKKLMEE